MAEIKFQKDINASKLLEELKESGLINKIEELRTKGDQIFVVTNSKLTPEEETALQSVITGHMKEDGLEIEVENVRQEISFGMDLLSELAVNLRKHSSSSIQLLEVVERFSVFQQLIYGGHLELAVEELSKIQVDDLLPKELIDLLVKKLRARVDMVKNG